MVSDATIVVGAGIVGLACAVEAQRRGGSVTIIDRDDPGHGCSFGNAGIVAASEIFPLISSSRVMGFPLMLLSRDAPAIVRMASLGQFVPWMLRAAKTLTPARQHAITDGLSALNGAAVSAWRDLLGACDASDMLRERGMIRLLRDERDRAALKKTHDLLAERSLPSCLLTKEEVRELEPGIGDKVIGGLLHESDADLGDPLHISQALLERFRAGGGKLLRESVISLRPGNNDTEVLTDTNKHVAPQVLVTSGLQSREIMAPLGVTVPLQAERGYHLMLPGHGDLLSRPVTFQRESCVATSMGTDLRLAGTVEFADDAAPPDWRRAESLAAHAAQYFNVRLSRKDSAQWVGSRPSLPDSLPAIGRLSAMPGIGYAFGHQHLGVTQAAISARLLCDMMSGKMPPIDCRPYDIARFAK